MLEEWESPIGFSGSIQADSITRKKLAKESGLYNLEKYPIFMELFPGKIYFNSCADSWHERVKEVRNSDQGINESDK